MTIYKKNLEAGYHHFDLSVGSLPTSIDVKVEGKGFFITLFLYQNNEQVLQITANKSTSRTITRDKITTSPACSPLNGGDNLSLEYALFVVGDDEVTFEITESQDLIAYENEIDIYEDRVIDKTKRWYSGDFHTHTFYSDGKLSREENLVVAHGRDLDFFTPTEHNVFHRSWPETDILIIPGMEFTSDLGHFNILFSEIDHLEEGELGEFLREEDFIDLLDKYSAYGIISLNHPFMDPWDNKMGSLSLDKIKVMEIINDPTYGSSEEAYEKALKAWTLMLNDGYKTVAIGGSDSHNIPQESYEQSAYPSLIGDPKTWIYADGLSKASLKEGLLAGRVCVSREDVIDLKQDGESFRVRCARTYYHKERLKILWIVNGEVVKESFSNEDELILEPTNDYGWIRVDIRTESGYLFGFTNPIFINEDKKPDHKLLVWQDVMDRMND